MRICTAILKDVVFNTTSSPSFVFFGLFFVTFVFGCGAAALRNLWNDPENAIALTANLPPLTVAAARQNR